PPSSPLFPYTTLFRSWVTYRDYALAAGLLADLAFADCVEFEDRAKNPQVRLADEGAEAGGAPSGAGSDAGPAAGSDAGVGQEGRSEEHTSELQSRFDL